MKEALREMRGPIVLISNLLTEGSGMEGFTAADAAKWVARAIGRPVDVVIANTSRPSAEMLARYAAEHKTPLELGTWTRGSKLFSGRSGRPRSRVTIAGDCRSRSGQC